MRAACSLARTRLCTSSASATERDTLPTIVPAEVVTSEMTLTDRDDIWPLVVSPLFAQRRLVSLVSWAMTMHESAVDVPRATSTAACISIMPARSRR